MIVKINHFFQEHKNTILLFLIVYPLQILVLHAVLGINSNSLFMYYVGLFSIEFVIYSIIISFRGHMYINKISMYKNGYNYWSEDNEYSAVLIGNNLSWIKNISTYVGACGLYFLVEYFKNTNKHYKICQKVDKSNFDFVLDDEKCQELYILGHGSKGSFSINKKTDVNDGKICYSTYKSAPKKRVIGQIHCANSAFGNNIESLVDLLATDTDNSYVGSGTIYFFNEWWYYLNLWANNMQTPPTSAFKRHLFYIIKGIQK